MEWICISISKCKIINQIMNSLITSKPKRVFLTPWCFGSFETLFMSILMLPCCRIQPRYSFRVLELYFLKIIEVIYHFQQPELMGMQTFALICTIILSLLYNCFHSIVTVLKAGCSSRFCLESFFLDVCVLTLLFCAQI